LAVNILISPECGRAGLLTSRIRQVFEFLEDGHIDDVAAITGMDDNEAAMTVCLAGREQTLIDARTSRLERLLKAPSESRHGLDPAIVAAGNRDLEIVVEHV